MKELIETREDVIANIKTLYSYLNNESDKNSYEWAIERLSKGRNYVVEIIDSQICFAPSRFVGYKKNTKKKHSGENQGDGKETDPQLKKLYKIVQDGRLDELFQSEIRQYGLSSGSKKYFISKDMTVDEILKYADNPNADKYVNLLESNHNLILTGAPGTGKTYLAKQIAQQMIFGEVKEKMNDEEQKQFNEQTDFVQFHPSYDYTDFVEGLRPTPPNEDGNVGFERKDGVFKEFCAKALKNYMDSSKQKNEIKDDEVFEKVYSSLLNDIEDETIATYPTKRSGEQPVFLNEKRQIKLGQSNGKPKSVKKEYLKILFGLYKDENINHSEMSQEVINEAATKFIDGVNSLDYIQYRWTLSELVKKYKKLKNTISLEQIQTIELKPFVFIIDEINRGEINKIFGELFFSIDPGYRGEKGRVQTQYQNMVEDDAFKKGFFVPENVYIIGTMNDIDRSVESMDFAFRRRFAFKEVTADDSKAMLDSAEAWGKDENGNSLKPDDGTIGIAREKLENINKVIWHKLENDEKEEDKPIEGLSSAYHIGASYFLKLINYKKEDGSYNFDELWEYHLEGLLFEYLRGTTDIYKKLKRLAIAYGYSNADKYE